MRIPAEKIISEALQLPQKSRALVAERLIESLDYPEAEKNFPPNGMMKSLNAVTFAKSQQSNQAYYCVLCAAVRKAL
jgi:hypothetical protein